MPRPPGAHSRGESLPVRDARAAAEPRPAARRIPVSGRCPRPAGKDHAGDRRLLRHGGPRHRSLRWCRPGRQVADGGWRLAALPVPDPARGAGRGGGAQAPPAGPNGGRAGGPGRPVCVRRPGPGPARGRGPGRLAAGGSLVPARPDRRGGGGRGRLYRAAGRREVSAPGAAGLRRLADLAAGLRPLGRRRRGREGSGHGGPAGGRRRAIGRAIRPV
jgi:translation initiation factor IF-2